MPACWTPRALAISATYTYASGGSRDQNTVRGANKSDIAQANQHQDASVEHRSDTGR